MIWLIQSFLGIKVLIHCQGLLNDSKNTLELNIHKKYKRKSNGNMDRGHGATYTGGDNHLLEYWEEYQKMIEETKMLDDYLDEECGPRSYDGLCY